MGEYADMMLEGDCCQFCGEYIGEGDGWPRSCGCDGADGDDEDFSLGPVTFIDRGRKPGPYQCRHCDRSFKAYHSLRQHSADKHNAPLPNELSLLAFAHDFAQTPLAGEPGFADGDEDAIADLAAAVRQARELLGLPDREDAS